jgi:diguanylate cyclase (GGDEF)-like protein
MRTRRRAAFGIATQRRDEIARGRVDAAAARDTVAHARDQAAAARDQAADSRDSERAARDVTWSNDGGPGTSAEIMPRAAENRGHAAADRTVAAEARARAAADRVDAAEDREQAATDREQGQADHEALVHQLLIAETDGLTGARTRGAGLADLEHEIDRARRFTGRLVVAYVDVVGLKAVNDLHGHAAGDQLLQRAVRAIREQLRSYDLIVRVGGDEFVCVLSGANLEEARERFALVRDALAADPEPCEIKVGFADLKAEESAARLVERADADLPTSPRH